MNDAKQLILDSVDDTQLALAAMSNLQDTVKLYQVKDIRDRLARAASRMTSVVSIVAGNEPPKSGEVREEK